MSKKLCVYHTEWSTYGRNFQVNQLPEGIDEISYSFLNVNSDGSVTIADPYASLEKRFTDPLQDVDGKPDSWNETKPFFGNYNQLLELSKRPNGPKITIAIGGWTFSKYFSDAVRPGVQDTFVTNLKAFLDKYPFFTGASFDFEYPSEAGKNYGNDGNISKPGDATAFLNFLTKFKKACPKIHIASCFSADPKKVDYDPSMFNNVLDSFHIMTYDFSDGNWGDKVTGHNANIRKTPYCSFSVEDAVSFFIDKGVPSQKIMIGAAAYSRGFSNTEGPGKPCSGGSPDKSWETGVVDLKDCPVPGSVEYFDPLALASYSYDSSRKVLNSYDNIFTASLKCQLVHRRNLQGIIQWESSADYRKGNPNSIIAQMDKGLHKKDFTVSRKPVIQPGFFQGVKLPDFGNESTLPNPPTPVPTPVPSQKETMSFVIDTGAYYDLKPQASQNSGVILVRGKVVDKQTQKEHTRLVIEHSREDVMNIPQEKSAIIPMTVRRVFK